MTRTLTLAAAASVLLLFSLIWVGQRKLMYFPDRNVPPPMAVGLGNVEAVTFPTQDDVTLHGWFLPSAQTTRPFTVMVLNGNGGNRAYRARLGDALRARGCAVLLFDYRGYGENAGTPSEDGLARDARAARAYLIGRHDIDPNRMIYFGESLGTAVATRLAAEHPPAGLILRSPFASMVELGGMHYPMLPVKWLLRDRFVAMSHIRQVGSPLLVIAGSHDRIVPVEQSRRLYEAAPSRKTLVVVRGADHNDRELLVGAEMLAAVDTFLSTLE